MCQTIVTYFYNLLYFSSYVYKCFADNEHAVLLFECLLEENPSFNISDNMGKTVMQKAIAILCGREKVNNYPVNYNVSEHRFKTVSSHVQRLLEAGVTSDQKDLNDALIMCAKKSDFKGMECIIRHGGDCNKDEYGKTVFNLCWLHCK